MNSFIEMSFNGPAQASVGEQVEFQYHVDFKAPLLPQPYVVQSDIYGPVSVFYSHFRSLIHFTVDKSSGGALFDPAIPSAADFSVWRTFETAGDYDVWLTYFFFYDYDRNALCDSPYGNCTVGEFTDSIFLDQLGGLKTHIEVVATSASLAFPVTPIPEPSVSWLLLFGLILVGWKQCFT